MDLFLQQQRYKTMAQHENVKEVTIAIDVDLLKVQISYMLNLPSQYFPNAEGIINMMEAMVDQAEGYSATNTINQ